MRKTFIIRTLILSLAAMLIFGAVSLALIGHYSREAVKNDLIRVSDIIKDEAERAAGSDAESHLVLFENTGKQAFRVTFIRSDGSVIADSLQQGLDENHLDRPEVKSALANERKFYTRKSATLNCRMMYYAVSYKNKAGISNILRVAIEVTSVSRYVWSALPLLLGLTAVLAALLVIFNNRYNNSILQPVNKLKAELQNINSGRFNKISIDKSNKDMLPVINEINEIGESLQKLNNNRRDFFAAASHELNTPLTCISGYSELMMQGMIGADKVKETGAIINGEAQRMSTLISDMLKLSGMENAAAAPVIAEINLRKIIDAAVADFSAAAAAKDIKIHVQCWETVIRSDGKLLKTILENLIGNAVKYNVNGGKVNVSVRRADGKIEISVKDTGIGIAAADRERIFERFYRVDKSRGKKTGGTGLGLAIVKHSAALLSGTVSLESELGKGSEFIVSLPENP